MRFQNYLDDWNRDVVRMTKSNSVNKRQCTCNFTPNTVFKENLENCCCHQKTNLCSPTNINNILKFLKYAEIAHTISKQFFLQFEVFEGALERDIMMFFKDPLSILKQNVDAAQRDTGR